MSNQVTISTHNGSAVAREHNIRNPRIVGRESHIRTDGVYEIWRDTAPRLAYKNLFGDAVKQYNARQHRADRTIKNYYNLVSADAKKHPVYEMIIGIYGRGEDGAPVCPVDTGKQIMQQFVDEWEQRNPNLHLIGAYYHADEEGEPHVHIDYIPVAHGYNKGLAVQNGLVRALGEMQFSKCGKDTAQIQWQRRENAVLEQLVRDRGLEVSHPLEEGRRHLDTALYKQHAALDGTIDQTQQLSVINEQLRADNAREEARKRQLIKETAEILEQRYKLLRLRPDKVMNYYLCTMDPEQIISIAQSLKQYALTDKDISAAAAQELAAAQKLKAENLLLTNENERVAASLDDRILAAATSMSQKMIESNKAVYTQEIEQLRAYLGRLQLANGKTALQAFDDEKCRNQALEL